LASGRLSRQASIVAEASGVPRTRLSQWLLAYAGLSAAWTINTGKEPEIALAGDSRFSSANRRCNIPTGSAIRPSN
jgi:streptomycin 6-kinase